MVYSSDRTMVLRTLFLSSCCFLGLLRHSSGHNHSDEDGSGSGSGMFNSSSNDEDYMASSEGPLVRHFPDPTYLFPPGWPKGSLVPRPTDNPPMGYDMMYCEMIIKGQIWHHPDEIPFNCICSYCKGRAGPKGARGDRGAPGSPGSAGERGMKGMKGQRGFVGPSGIKGQKGDLGGKGQPGATGAMGSKGQRGFKGEKGDQGLMGRQGAQGPQGETGMCPAACESIPGAPGPQGPPGPVGGMGLPGAKGSVGSKGVKGAKGDLGRPGDQGDMGEKGDQGEKGECDCRDGMHGNDGQPGVMGDKGDKGDTGAKGVQGPTGMKGDLGLMGPMGIPGPCSPAIQSSFSACLTESFPKKDWPVAFEKVLFNKQQHFNPSMGMYRAPVNGTYVFSFHLSVAVKPLKVGIFLNSKPVAKITQVQNPSTTSFEVVLHLRMGDRVWLQVKSNYNGMYASGESTSSFSGYLLYPVSCEMPLGRSVDPSPSTATPDYKWG